MMACRQKLEQAHGGFHRSRFSDNFNAILGALIIYLVNEISVITAEALTACLSVMLCRQRGEAERFLPVDRRREEHVFHA